MYNLSFILLHVSTLLTFILFFVMLMMKNKKELQYIAILLDFIVFLWCAAFLVQQYIGNIYHYNGMIITNISFSIAGLIPFTLFAFGLNYAFPDVRRKFKYYYLYIVPIIGIALIWTNQYHHLYFISYSLINSSFVKGPYFIAQSVVATVLDILGFYFLIRFSIKNSGFFSRQSLLIVVGTLFPFCVDMAYVFKLFSFPLYYEPISFTIAIAFYMVSIFKFGLLRIVPIALQTVVDHISDSYIVINEKFEIIDFNKPFTDNFNDVAKAVRKDNLRVPLHQISLISSVSYEQFLNAIKEAVEGNKSVSFDDNIQSEKIDKNFTVEITPIYAQDSYRGSVILLKDVTEQRKSYEMMRKTQVMLIESEHLAQLGQLVGGIAHNLKTPIMSISGGLEGLSDLIDEYDDSIEDEEVTPQDHHEIANDMRTWITKMKEYTSYMSDVITTVKGQAVQLTATTTDSFTIRELVKRIDILMNHELKRFNCGLNVRCVIDMGTEAKGDVNSLIQVINNLITNAIQAYEGKEGTIDFIISRAEEMLQFVVRDYGSGMKDDVKSKLFKEMITTKAKNGTGLGLYMSYSTITGRFGGKMWFESVCGEGTTFYVQIPAKG